MSIVNMTTLRMANLEAETDYLKYESLLKQMGEEKTVDYTVEGLVTAQRAMQAARRRDAVEKDKLKVDEGGGIRWADLVNHKDDYVDFDIHSSPLEWVVGMHPIFTLAHHARGMDYGHNQIVDVSVRGDVMSIPVVSEGGEVYYVSLGFHKGDMKVFFTYFPDRHFKIKDKLIELLNTYETR